MVETLAGLETVVLEKGPPAGEERFTMTLHQLYVDRYLPLIQRNLKPKTVAEYDRLWIQSVNPILGSHDIKAITMDDAEKVHLFTAGAVQANRALALLSAMLGYAVQRQLIPFNPCVGIKRNKEKGREFFYSKEQTRALLNVAAGPGPVQYEYIALELLTGCRPGELLEAAPAWRHRAVLRTPDGKTGARTIYLPPAACAILDLRPVHEWSDGTRRYFPEGMSLRRSWERLCKEAGVPRARLYDLRHTFASQALGAQQSLGVVGRLLGHRKAQTTLRYAHLAPDVAHEAVAAAAERMGASK
jgi:integrase